MDSKEKTNSPWLIGLTVAAAIATILGFLVEIGVIKLGPSSTSSTTPSTAYASPTALPPSTATSAPTPVPTPIPSTPTPAPSSYLVNDSDSSIIYVAYVNQWQYNGSRGLGDYQDDVHYLYGNTGVPTPDTNGGGSGYISYTFTGTGIEYISEKESDEGRVGIYLDGAFISTIDCFNQTRLVQQVIYRVNNLPSGRHTIKITAYNGGATLLDAFRVYL